MAISSISQIKLPDNSTYALKDARLSSSVAGVLSSDGSAISGVSETYFRPVVKVLSADPVRTDLSVIKITASDYYNLVVTSAVLSNALYIVEDTHKDAYGQQLKNLAAGTESADAVNLGQLSANYATTASLTSYLTKTDAASTYLTQTAASTNYVTKTQLSGTNGILTGYSKTGHTHSQYALSSRSIAGYKLSNDITVANISSAIGLSSYSVKGHGHYADDIFFEGTHDSGDTVQWAIESISSDMSSNYYTKDDLTGTGGGGSGSGSSDYGILGDYSLTGHTHPDYVPKTTTVAGKQLTGNVYLNALSFGNNQVYDGTASNTIYGADLAYSSTSSTTKLSDAFASKDHTHSSQDIYLSRLIFGVDGCSYYDGKDCAYLYGSNIVYSSSDQTPLSAAVKSSYLTANYYSRDEIGGSHGILTSYYSKSELTSSVLTAYVPKTTTVAGKQLSGNVSLSQIDFGTVALDQDQGVSFCYKYDGVSSVSANAHTISYGNSGAGTSMYDYSCASIAGVIEKEARYYRWTYQYQNGSSVSSFNVYDKCINTISGMVSGSRISITFPNPVSAHMTGWQNRDFAVRLVGSSGYIAGTTVDLPGSYTYMTPDGSLPSVEGPETLIYFSEIGCNTFYVKFDDVKEVGS